MKTTFKISLLTIFAMANLIQAKAQITSGKIVYERKTNLIKKYKDDWVKEYVKNDKIKSDFFELYFNDSLSSFKYQENDLKEQYEWAPTSKNEVYQNLNSNYRLTIKDIWREKFYVEDTLFQRKWKITDSKRMICGYNCRKAIWQANDSTRIYAWYCDEIIPNIGPESFYGLPGAILGLATEDGGVIYFAKSVEAIKPDIVTLTLKKSKNKIYKGPELKAKLQKDYGKERWGKQMINENFGIW